MKRGIDLDQKSYSITVIFGHGASPDTKVYDPTEVKCSNVDHITEASHIKFANGQAKLRRNHKYFWQVQDQLAITGLSWCDFITSNKSDHI